MTPTEEVTPPSKETPHPKAATPHPKAVTPHPKAVTPHPKTATPHPKAVTPHPKTATPHPKAVTPHPKAVTPHPESTTPHREPVNRHPESMTPPQTTRTAPTTLQRHVQTIQDTNFGKLPTVAARLREMTAFAGKLRQISTDREIPSVYLDALTSDARELKDVADAVSVNKALGTEEKMRLNQSVEDVHSDLYAKTSYAEKNPSDPFGFVTVKVTTRDKDGNEVSNCEVWCCLKGYVKYKDRYERFNQLSSPTSHPLHPGNYVMWARQGSVDGPQIPATDVGSDGQREFSIDLPTP
jgi:hypothetical protein